ncbi:hypothetical protein C2W62_01195 [Candidatus Entotheonella serta]|nr:hypothetical protein C2W62_01195 [Candidatus Entotheonella serta]
MKVNGCRERLAAEGDGGGKGTQEGERRKGNEGRGTKEGERRKGNAGRGTQEGERRKGNTGRGTKEGKHGKGNERMGGDWSKKMRLKVEPQSAGRGAVSFRLCVAT